MNNKQTPENLALKEQLALGYSEDYALIKDHLIVHTIGSQQEKDEPIVTNPRTGKTYICKLIEA